MHRFFVPPDCIRNNEANLPAETAHQIRKVLRLKEGQTVCLLDNSGTAFEAELEYADMDTIHGHILRSYPVETEPACSLKLYLALTQREKFEWILQKCTEAGVSAIVPVYTERSLVRRDKNSDAKLPRWGKILQEAAEQSGRGIIPRLYPPQELAAAVRMEIDTSCKLFFWEEERERTLRVMLEPVKAGVKKTALFIGPEGGFSAREAGLAILHGWQPVTLGTRIYRMETAAIASIILTLYEIERD